MAGRKLFINHVEVPIDVTIYVRKGERPEEQAGPVQFKLKPNVPQYIDYGNDVNIYLNGLQISGEHQGAKIVSEKKVVPRGCPFDDELNRNNTVEIFMDHNFFYITTRNS